MTRAEMLHHIEILERKNVALVNTIEYALDAVGTGKCKLNTCESCKLELDIAINILKTATQ